MSSSFQPTTLYISKLGHTVASGQPMGFRIHYGGQYWNVPCTDVIDIRDLFSFIRQDAIVEQAFESSLTFNLVRYIVSKHTVAQGEQLAFIANKFNDASMAGRTLRDVLYNAGLPTSFQNKLLLSLLVVYFHEAIEQPIIFNSILY